MNAELTSESTSLTVSHWHPLVFWFLCKKLFILVKGHHCHYCDRPDLPRHLVSGFMKIPNWDSSLVPRFSHSGSSLVRGVREWTIPIYNLHRNAYKSLGKRQRSKHYLKRPLWTQGLVV